MKYLKQSILLLMIPALALAHHGFAEFDQSTTTTLQGIVTEFHYTNPHSVVDFDVKTADGKIENWKGEMGNPLHLKGWTATSLQPGDEVTISGFRAKRGSFYMWVTGLKSSSGVEIRHKSGPARDE